MDPTKVIWKVKEWSQTRLEEELNNLSFLKYEIRCITPKRDEVNNRVTFVVIACMYDSESPLES
jgi:hypothetical protein